MNDTPLGGQALFDIASRLLMQIPDDDPLADLANELDRSLYWFGAGADGRRVLEAFAGVLETVSPTDPAGELCTTLSGWLQMKHTDLRQRGRSAERQDPDLHR